MTRTMPLVVALAMSARTGYYWECWAYEVPLPVEIEVNLGGVGSRVAYFA